MLCQSCNKNEATIHFTKIINGSMEERHICEDCAKLESEIGFTMPMSLSDFFGGLLDYGQKEEGDLDEKVCPKCGITYNRLLSSGKFGCSKCFETFERDISSLLKNIHGHDEHIGKIPSKSSEKLKYRKEKDRLEVLLNQAITNEEFELAAKYRDEIKEIDEKMKSIGKNIDEQ